ncbi:unnamed protein product, partial [Oikopleura dioica]
SMLLLHKPYDAITTAELDFFASRKFCSRFLRCSSPVKRNCSKFGAHFFSSLSQLAISELGTKIKKCVASSMSTSAEINAAT